MWHLDKFIDRLLDECKDNNEPFARCLTNIKHLDEHGMPVSYIDVYSAFHTFVIRQHNREKNYDYADWEKNCFKILDENFSKIEFSCLDRRIKDLVAGFDK